ncbi:MAG TPA: hypothetical protein VHA56_17105 [Mucilaginibacter sp.]|nr:hypothetical protein [Mucilaginibacter sp.]
MKKIHYLFAFVALAFAFASCNPLDKTYKELGPVPQPTITPQNLTVTLSAADYATLPSSNYAKKSLSFKTKDDAAASIPLILASKYPNYPEKSTASVTYAFSPVTVKLADSVFNDVAYTLTHDDYLLLPGNKYADFSASQILKWLPYKYPDPSPNQLALLTFTYYENGVQSEQTQSFLFLNDAWVKIYTISPEQYNSIGKGGNYNDFSSSDNANLPAYFNTFLKADPAVAATAHAGDVQYVSYKYYSGGNFQRVLPLTFDGTNWITAATSATLSFSIINGTWIADNTVYYALGSTDYTFIASIPDIAPQAATDNLKQYGDFSLSGASGWTDDQINTGVIALLKSKFTTAVANQKFVITYEAYSGGTITVTKTFQYNGTTFVYVP